MSGQRSNSRSPPCSPRRSRSPSRSPEERRGDKYYSRRRRSRSDDRGRRNTSSRFDRSRESRGRDSRVAVSRYDDRNGRRSRSEEARKRRRRDDSRSRSRSRTRDRSPHRSRRERSRSRDRVHGSIDRESYFLISHRDHIVRNAGKIAWGVRRGEKLKPMMASGPAAVATALGILARVRQFLAEDKSPSEILFSPRFQSKQRREKIVFYLKTEPGQRRGPSDNEESLTVSSRSKIAPIAGAIAGRARDNGVGVLLEAIGDDAVQICVSAMAMARDFLEDDKITFYAIVSLQEIKKEGKDGIRRELVNFRVKCYLDNN